jgi:hypothetical protein
MEPAIQYVLSEGAGEDEWLVLDAGHGPVVVLHGVVVHGDAVEQEAA